MKINPLTAVDFYKCCHRDQYPVGTTMVYSNLTPRSAKLSNIPNFTGEVTWFGLQFFIKEFLQETWGSFFDSPKDEVVAAYKRRMDTSLGHGVVGTDHIEALHDLGYLPICIKALPEGTQVPIKVPCMVIFNTLPEFFWLTNYLETALSAYLWKPTTSATIAHHYRLLLEKLAEETGVDKNFVRFQGHDFSCRGLSGIQDAALTGAGHLTSFCGTDTILAIDLIESYYNANATQELIGCSVPSSEHSCMCMGGKDDELETYRRFITELYPSGTVGIVSDTWDLWKVLTDYTVSLKDEILGRDGTVCFRPDSGDPVEIICGEAIDNLDDARDLSVAKGFAYDILRERIADETPHGECGDDSITGLFSFQGQAYRATLEVFWNRHDKQYYYIDESRLKSFVEVELTPAQKGAVSCLWDVFGGTVNEKAYKVLDPHVSLIYGDSITLERAEAILKGLEAKGFASSNIFFGVGSFTYNYTTRDTLGFAVKSTFGMVNGEAREIFKDPVTDGGTKKSARGLLSVQNYDGRLTLVDRQPAIDMPGCQLREVYRDGVLLIDESFTTIRKRAGFAGEQGVGV